MTHPSRALATILGCIAVFAAFPKCPPATPQVASAGKAVGTMIKTSGIGLNPTACAPGTPPQTDYRAWYNGLSPANRAWAYAGFEIWRNSTCTASTVHAYRALVTFNMASVSQYKGLVQKAELIVSTAALPASAGGVSTLGVPVNVVCPASFGGAAELQRFGPAAAAALPTLSNNASLIELAPTDPFPTGQTVYMFPTTPTPGAVAGATSPTVLSLTGTGGVVFTTTVTGQVDAALNGGAAGMSWMLTSVFEGPLPGQVRVGGELDCRTAYNFDLQITHN